MAWTKVAKPTTNTWTKQTFAGNQIFDDSSLIYDDTSVFYDSYNPSQYTKVAKPTANNWVKVAKPI